jgi:predicted metal-dependent phosphoesterase TrpH
MEEPAEAVKQAKQAGLSGIAITDHNNNAGWKEAREEAKRQGIIFIPGMEISSRRGHILGLGISDRIQSGLSVEETVERIHEAGGIAVAAHPFDIRGHGLKDWFHETDAVEAFNALSVDRFSNIVASRKARSLDMPVTSGSDAHTLGMIGRAPIEARADDLDSLLKEIKRGGVGICKRYVHISEIKEWSRLRMINAYIDVLSYIDDRYGRHRAWLLKKLVGRFMFSNDPIWDVAARVSLTGAIAYSLIKAFAYY